MRCIQLGSSLGCSTVPQVHFVRKQTMCKSVCTYLTICFAFGKPRWLLHNTADRAETVFSHLNSDDCRPLLVFHWPEKVPGEPFLYKTQRVSV